MAGILFVGSAGAHQDWSIEVPASVLKIESPCVKAKVNRYLDANHYPIHYKVLNEFHQGCPGPSPSADMNALELQRRAVN